MPTGRHTLISLGSTYFTTDGLSTGTPCKTDVTGLNIVKAGRLGQTNVAIDGTPWTQTFPINGAPISFSVFRMSSALLTTVSDAIRASTNLSLTITGGAFGNFYLTVIPNWPEPITFNGEFYLSTAHDVTFNFIIVSQTYTLTASAGSISITGQNLTLTAG